MVVIFTNENNPAGLKLVLSTKLAGINAEVKLVNLTDASHFPYVKVSDDQNIFIPNAGVWFFFPSAENISSKVTEILEWEASSLCPNLALTIGSNVKSEKLRNGLLTALKTLNKDLENKQYLVDDKLSAADVVIWSTLCSLCKCEKLLNEYLSDLPNLTQWLKKLGDEQVFKESSECVKLTGGQISYQALQNGVKYLIPCQVNQSKEQDKESPKHEVEVVSNQELDNAKKAWQKSIKDLPLLTKHKKEVLPESGKKNIFITSSLPYVNNVPHLGNIIGCVLSADVFARFSRLCNYNTLYICGTDEYGTATETKALEEGLSCREICDKYFTIHKEVYDWFNISFDHFGRTTTPEQTELCQDMFLQLNNNGFIFTQSVEQLHCEKCDRYLADRFVEGGCPNVGCNYEDARGDQCDSCGKLVNAVELKNPRCKVCKTTPKLKTSDQFFIDLSKLEPLVRHWMKISSPGWSHNAQVIAKAWLREGLKPRCITRDLKWGVPVPVNGYRDKVFYVWFDAPIGYMSISKAYTGEYEKWWQPSKDTEVTYYQFMAKDNVPFHAVLFPSMLLGANRGYVNVSHIMATEYLNYEDGKFSKSRGIGVFGTDAKSTGIPSDVWRFYLLYVRPESQDSSFSWNDLVTKNNSELLNNLGNFVNRALVFAKNNFDRTIPPIAPNNDDYTLLALCTRELKSYVSSLEKAKLRDGIRHILAISRHGNQYMQSNQPWVLLKGTEEEKLRAGTVIGICSNLACLLSVLLEPYMPVTSESLKKQLNAPDIPITPNNIEIVTLLAPGHKIGEPFPLFAKIEPERAEQLKQKFAGSPSQTPKVSNNLDAKKLEEEVSKQADKVRALKSSGTDKKLWQPEVSILLELKKKLEMTLKSVTSKKPEVPALSVKELEEAVAKQGDKVRALKTGGAEKSVWQPEVSVLLDLKGKLEAAKKASQSQESTVVNGIADPSEVKKLDSAKQETKKSKESGVEKSAQNQKGKKVKKVNVQ